MSRKGSGSQRWRNQQGRQRQSTDGPAAVHLLGEDVVERTVDRSSTCLYFAIDGPPPMTDPILVLNGEGVSESYPVNNVCFPSTVPSLPMFRLP